MDLSKWKTMPSAGRSPDSFRNREEIIRPKPGNTKACTRGHWRPREDAKLKDLVTKFGPQNWNLIAEKMEGRSGKSCRLRWFNQLDPRINRNAFTEEEEDRLLAAQAMYGNKWAMISRLFPGRTDNGVKNHWHVVMARKRREERRIYRRRRPPPCSVQIETSVSGNYYSSNLDQELSSESTCTDLSLSPSSLKAPHLLSCITLSSFGPPAGLERSEIRGNNQVPGRANKANGESGHSESNSESVANLYNTCGENKIEKFIDFLGVGPT